jgi:hypothetical protein
MLCMPNNNLKDVIYGVSSMTRIGIRGTTPHRLGRLKEGSAMTRPTIQKVLEDLSVLPKT